MASREQSTDAELAMHFDYLRQGGNFCNCHNGLYDINGRNIAGPPPRPLEVYQAVKGSGKPGQEEIIISRKAWKTSNLKIREGVIEKRRRDFFFNRLGLKRRKENDTASIPGLESRFKKCDLLA